MSLTLSGERKLNLRFEQFPQELRERLRARIAVVAERLRDRIRAAAPVKTGRLRSEIVSTVYADNPQRVAAYVEVSAPGVVGEYAKAATLEYGSDKPRRVFERKGGLAARLTGGKRHLIGRTGAARIAPRRYLRGPFDELKPEIEHALGEAIADAASEESE